MKTQPKQNRRPKIDKQIALAAVPVPNSEVLTETLASGRMLLRYPVMMRPWMVRWVRRLKGASPPIRFRKLELDRLGTDVWQMIDGKRSVQDIIDTFARIHQLPTAESESAITQFLRDLGRRGMIGMRS